MVRLGLAVIFTILTSFVNGEIILPNKKLYRVSLQSKFLMFWFEFCDGTILDPNVVVTAKSCVVGRDKDSIRIIASDTGFTHTRTLIHSINYNADVAVITLNGSIAFSNKMIPNMKCSEPPADKKVQLISSASFNAVFPFLPHHLLGTFRSFASYFWGPWVLIGDTYEIVDCESGTPDIVVCAKLKSGWVGPCESNLGSAIFVGDDLIGILVSFNGIICDARKNYVKFQLVKC